MPTCKIRLTCTVIIVCTLFSGCLGVPKERKLRGDRLAYAEAQEAFDAKDYVEAIKLFEDFLEQHPKSDGYTWALQRIGESMEALLEMEYTRRIKHGHPPDSTAKDFLERFGHYNCWTQTPDGLSYNMAHYKKILEQYPDSPIADEAAFRMIPFADTFVGKPEAALKEIVEMEAVLQNYPTTSLRSEILYKMAWRSHYLYELYYFSPRLSIRNRQEAETYREKAVYLYRLALKSTYATEYSEKAWEALRKLEQGERIFSLE